jgi:hypothetical protein
MSDSVICTGDFSSIESSSEASACFVTEGLSDNSARRQYTGKLYRTFARDTKTHSLVREPPCDLNDARVGQ